MKVSIGSKFTQLPTMSQDEKLLQAALLAEPNYTAYALKDLAVMLVSTVIICTLAGYVYAKLQNHPLKKSIPDCGICSIYKK